MNHEDLTDAPFTNIPNVVSTLRHDVSDIRLDSVAGRAAFAFAISRDQTQVLAGANGNTKAAILLDDSGSMSGTDPQRMRAQAAQLFWEALLPVRAGNLAALLDFGAGATTDFTDTRLLQTWTSSGAALQAKLTSVIASGSTPLYESLVETVTWMTSTTSQSDNRVILLLTDGQPNGTGGRPAAINAAQGAGITVHTVGLGPASDLDASSQSAAVAAVREVAEQTGGVYSVATTAAALTTIFKVLATASGKGQLLGTFKISPVPVTGTSVRGTVTVSSGGRSGVAMFSFLAP